jgi:hypothetical protein
MPRRECRSQSAGCGCIHTPPFRCIVGIAAVTLLVMLAAGAARRATVSTAKHVDALLQRAGASLGAQASDEVWRGVTSVNTSVPQLCRAGADLVCARYNAVVVLGGGPADKDGSLPEWHLLSNVPYVYSTCTRALNFEHFC